MRHSFRSTYAAGGTVSPREVQQVQEPRFVASSGSDRVAMPVVSAPFGFVPTRSVRRAGPGGVFVGLPSLATL